MTEEPWEDPVEEAVQADAGRSGPTWEREGASPGSFLATAKAVLLAPTSMFQSMRREGGMGSPLLFAACGGAIAIVAGTIYQCVFGMLSGSLAINELIIGLVAAPVVMVILLFVGACIHHLILMAMGCGQRGFETTFRVEAYTVGATWLLGVIPLCGSILGIPWVIVCLIIGLAEAHEISRGKAAVAVLIPIVLCCLGMTLIVATTGMLAQHLAQHLG